MITAPTAAIAEAVAALTSRDDVKSATKFVSPILMARATYRTKLDGNRVEITITYGQPNFEERKFVKLCKRAGEPFPVRKVQFKPWPKKRPRHNRVTGGLQPSVQNLGQQILP